MPTFNDFVQTELPLRPFAASDGTAGQVPVRSSNPLAARELTWTDPSALGNTTITLLASAALGGHRLVVADATGKAAYADIGNASHAQNIIGLTLGAAALNAPVAIATAGYVDEPSWTWTPLLPIYWSGVGLLTQTVPTSGRMVQVAVPITATRVLVAIKMPITLV